MKIRTRRAVTTLLPLMVAVVTGPFGVVGQLVQPTMGFVHSAEFWVLVVVVVPLTVVTTRAPHGTYGGGHARAASGSAFTAKIAEVTKERRRATRICNNNKL